MEKENAYGEGYEPCRECDGQEYREMCVTHSVHGDLYIVCPFCGGTGWEVKEEEDDE